MLSRTLSVAVEVGRVPFVRSREAATSFLADGMSLDIVLDLSRTSLA